MEIQNIALRDLRLFDGNARHGNVDKIANSLEVNGQYKPIVVNRGTHTEIANEVLAGNHTVMAARTLGWKSIDAVIVDVDRTSALRIVLADNQTADSATNDNDALLELLDELDHDFNGTGFSEDEVARLLGDIDIPDDGGDADIDDPAMNWGVIVDCADEHEQTQTLQRLIDLGLDVRAVM